VAEYIITIADRQSTVTLFMRMKPDALAVESTTRGRPHLSLNVFLQTTGQSRAPAFITTMLRQSLQSVIFSAIQATATRIFITTIRHL
jgi:hypothetical protein